MINLEGDLDTRQDSREESRAPCIYHRKELGGPIANRKILLAHRLHIPCDISKSLAPLSRRRCPFSYTLLKRTARIVGSPGPPRVAIRGHRRLQPASKSGSSPSRSVSRAPSSLFLQLAQEKPRARSMTEEKRNGVMYVPRYTMYVGSGREHRRSLQY